MKKTLMLLGLIVGLALSAGCFQQDAVTKKVTQENAINNLVVADNVSFDFFDDVKVNLKGQSGAVVQIYSQDPATGGKPVVTDLLDEEGNFSDEVNVESDGNLYLVAPNGEFANTKVAIVDGVANVTLLSKSVSKKRVTPILNPEWVGAERRLMFEDRNTDTTDFDFNDVVVDYSYLVNNKYVTENVDGKKVKVKYVESAEFTFDAMANGANDSDGFGFKLDGIKASTVEKVEINGVTSSFTSTLTDKVVVYVENNLITAFGGVTTNTVMSKPYVHTKNYRVVLTFKNATLPAKTQSSFTATINPFIFKTDNILSETHIMGKESVDNKTVNYKTSNGLPWAMELPVKVGYPIEKTSIINAYKKFELFAIGNNDKENKKWYKSPEKEYIYNAEDAGE